jgi:hypothetical protein
VRSEESRSARDQDTPLGKVATSHMLPFKVLRWSSVALKAGKRRVSPIQIRHILCERVAVIGNLEE